MTTQTPKKKPTQPEKAPPRRSFERPQLIQQPDVATLTHERTFAFS